MLEPSGAWLLHLIQAISYLAVLLTPLWWNPGTNGKFCPSCLVGQSRTQPLIFIQLPFEEWTAGLELHMLIGRFHPGKGTARTDKADRGTDIHPDGPFGVGGVVPFDAQNDCMSNPPIGGRLALFADRWEDITSDA